jgi:predicted helicase
VKEEKLAKVFYADLWGLRVEKYDYLLKNDVRTTQWKELKPTPPYYFFVPKDFALQAEYEQFWKVTEIFREYRNGVTTGQDKFFTDSDKQSLKARILAIFNRTLPNESLAELYKLKSQAGKKLILARKHCFYEATLLKSYAYRPFDTRWIYAENKFLWRSVEWLWKQFKGENIALNCTRILSTQHFSHIFVSDKVGDYCYISNKTKEFTMFFPLYLYPDESVGAIHELPLRNKSQPNRIPNFTPEFLQAIKASLETELTPEEIFFYIYAVLFSPTYRKRYEEFLKIDFPKIPLPSTFESFKELSSLGKELVDLHLLKHPDLDRTEVGFPKAGSNEVTKIKVVGADDNLSVYINQDQYFESIPKQVWEYRIGAYQVMEKYLKDRKGRKLSLEEVNHYMKMAKAIQLTIKLQKRIDEVYAP